MLIVSVVILKSVLHFAE